MPMTSGTAATAGSRKNPCRPDPGKTDGVEEPVQARIAVKRDMGRMFRAIQRKPCQLLSVPAYTEPEEVLFLHVSTPA
jgi:hypothetical protein